MNQVAALSICISSTLLGAGQVSRPSPAAVEKIISTHAVVGFEWADQPPNRIILIKTSKLTCALRFNYPAGDASNTGVGHSVDYDLINMSARSNAIGKVQHEKLVDRGVSGFGHWAWRRGNQEIRCGKIKISWLYPTGILLENGIEVAPTFWSKFEQINMESSGLRWFRNDKSLKRPVILISISDLPGSN